MTIQAIDKPKRTNPASAENGKRGGRPKSGVESRTERFTAAVSATVKCWLRTQPGDTVERLARLEAAQAADQSTSDEVIEGLIRKKMPKK